MVYVYCLQLCVQFMVNGNRVYMTFMAYGYVYGLRLWFIVWLWLQLMVMALVYGYNYALWLWFIIYSLWLMIYGYRLVLFFIVMVMIYVCKVLWFRFRFRVKGLVFRFKD